MSSVRIACTLPAEVATALDGACRRLGYRNKAALLRGMGILLVKAMKAEPREDEEETVEDMFNRLSDSEAVLWGNPPKISRSRHVQ